MKEKILEILQKVSNGELTPELAHNELLGLSFVSGLLPDENEIKAQYTINICDGNERYEYSFDAFVAGARWMKRVAIIGNNR